jgi:hypothetical protein
MRRFAVRALVASALLTGFGVAGQPAAAAERSAAESVTSALATCASWSDYLLDDGVFERRVPTITRMGYERRHCELRIGDRGPGVYVLQDALIRCYGQMIAQDAIFGEATRQAVRNVQAFHHVRIDGVYGPETNDAMVFAKYYRDTNIYHSCWYI